MADIRVLPPEVVNRIAAGEVVERPASVVKELVENSLDAGATRVEVEVRDGGKALIRVRDDGRGMGPEDLALAFVAHATSKLSDVEDLLDIGTLGFRGEALASIGAVARARIVSRRVGDAGGHEVVNVCGDVSEVRPAAAREGTTIEAVDLFRNVPARAGFLKSAGAEMAQITRTMHRFGISNPEVEFRLTHQGRKVADFPHGMERRERIARAFGRDLREELIEVSGEAEGLNLEALLAPPSRTFSDTTRMLFFLNGRHVRDRTLLHAARKAYEDLIFGPRSPMVFAFLTMDPALVDQNVHPAKLEVRFRSSSAVHSLVTRTFREGLTREAYAHPIALPGAGPAGTGREDRIRDAIADYLGREGSARAPNLFPGGRPGADRPAPTEDLGRAVDFLQVRDSFIVLETDQGITILDQHALHERVLYDRIRARYEGGELEVQRFLRPVVVDVAPDELERLLDVREELALLGVPIVRFGPDSVAVEGLPAAAGDADPAEVLEEILTRLVADESPGRSDLVDNVIATLACKAAVKAGDRLGRREVADLLVAAENLSHAQTCPHGRPTTLRIGYDQLERHFKR